MVQVQRGMGPVWRIVVLWALCTAVLMAGWGASPARAQSACDGLVTPQLTAGGAARVITSYGLSLKDQAATGAAGAKELGVLPYGSVVSVQDGYRCNFGYVWWQVRTADGTVGWAAEGANAGSYYLEPVEVGMYSYRREADGAQIVQYWVTPDGSARRGTVFPVAPGVATPADLWQPVELEWLGNLVRDAINACPQRMTGDWAAIQSAEQAAALPLAPYEYDYYPAPTGDRVLLVRHHHLLVPRCSTVVPARVGTSTVSVLSADGSEVVLFPFPQHGSVPESTDWYTDAEPDNWQVRLSEVVWSPNGKYIAFVAGYRYSCNREDCYRFHLYVSNPESGQLYVFGDARRVGWTNGGEGINFFRLVPTGDGGRVARLFTARPDGSARQEIWLPGGAEYVSGDEIPLDLPWADGGGRVMVGNSGWGEVMLLNVIDRSFTPPVVVPEMMPRVNRLGVLLMRGDQTYLWSTIRGDFVRQDARRGNWERLQSSVAPTGVAPVALRAFPDGLHALVEMADGSAYVLDMVGDALVGVNFPAP